VFFSLRIVLGCGIVIDFVLQALARAVYRKPDLILLDDIFSGLDRKSATHIFDAVFSEAGLLADMRCAVVLVTHSSTLSSCCFVAAYLTLPPSNPFEQLKKIH